MRCKTDFISSLSNNLLLRNEREVVALVCSKAQTHLSPVFHQAESEAKKEKLREQDALF